MDREFLPITFFERFSKLVLARDANFLNRELPDNLSEAYKKLNEEPRNKKDIKAMSAYRDWCSFMEKTLSVSVENLNDIVFDLKNHQNAKTKAKNHDSIYLANDHFALDEQSEDNRLGIKTKSTESIMGVLLETIWDFNDSGKKIFRLEENLTQELLLTEISKIGYEFLELPFQTICIHLPFNNSLKIRNSCVRWVYISQFEETDTTKKIKCLCLSDDDSYSADEFIFGEGEILKQLKDQIKILFGKSPLAMKEMTDFYTFLIGFLLYLNSDSLHQATKFPKIINKKLNSTIPVCSLGNDININKNFKTIYADSVNLDGEAREIHILKWMVRGHFRKQAHGIGRSERKVIWIRPFIKGKERENEEISAKPTNYNVK